MYTLPRQYKLVLVLVLILIFARLAFCAPTTLAPDHTIHQQDNSSSGGSNNGLTTDAKLAIGLGIAFAVLVVLSAVNFPRYC